MPLTEKGEEILHNMENEYGKEKGESVFYASANKGTISGVHPGDAEYKSVLPSTVSPADINEQNRRFWEQRGGETFPNE